jgi:hypothetical protein
MPTKSKSKSNNHKKGAALKFIASLVFLYVVLMGLHTGQWGSYVAGSVWAPLLVAAALLGSIVLFFGSLAEMVKPEMCMGSKPVMLVAFALIALTVGPLHNPMLWVTLVGFLIGWAGTAVERM